MNPRMNNVRFLLILFVTVGIFLCLSLARTSGKDKMKEIFEAWELIIKGDITQWVA